jgi:hypothetical protein
MTSAKHKRNFTVEQVKGGINAVLQYCQCPVTVQLG